jgi:hypothetical protein
MPQGVGPEFKLQYCQKPHQNKRKSKEEKEIMSNKVKNPSKI